MEETKEINWDDAVSGGGFVSLKSDEIKTIIITNWRLERTNKFGDEDAVEFISECIEEDGNPVEKLFTALSGRLKKKLRPILENRDRKEKVKLQQHQLLNRMGL